MSAPRFDPTEARALIADLREDADEMDRHYGGGQREPERSWIRNIRSAARELTLALTAISAIEDPEDGAGLREAFCIAYGYKEMPDIALETAPIEYDEFARFKAAVRRLATRAPSESAVSDEMVERAAVAIAVSTGGEGATRESFYECLDASEQDLWRKTALVALTAALSPTPEETKL